MLRRSAACVRPRRRGERDANAEEATGEKQFPREPNESARPALLPPARGARRGRVFCFLEGGPIEPKPASGRMAKRIGRYKSG